MVLTGQRRRALDAALVAWVVSWLALGFWVAREVRELGEVTNSLRNVGGAVVDAGEAIGKLDGLPVVGSAVSEPAGRIRTAGQGAVDAANDARSAANRLALLLGLCVALVPTLPLLVMYLPARAAFERDRRVVARGITDELLARRAVVHLPLTELRKVSSDPLADVDEGRFEALAAAELRRLGLPRY